MIVFTHRDPIVFVGSLLGVLQHMYTPITGRVFRGDFANELVDRFQAGFEAVSQANWPSDDRVINIRFDDFVQDQVGTIRRIYERNGLDFSPDYEKRMQSWLADPGNKSDRHGKFSYSLQQFGLDPADIKKKFASYYDRFLT